MVPVQTILVIVDDEDIRGDLQMLLEDQGYRVLTAPDGQTGLTRALADRPNIIICDMMMPKMSGFVVLERLKQNAQICMPFIMLTANESDHQKALAEFLGVDAYLNKPIRAKHLIEQVRQLCPLPASSPLRVTEVLATTVV